MDYETLVQLDETLENLADILSERGRGQYQAMFAKAFGKRAKDQEGRKDWPGVRDFRRSYAKDRGLNQKMAAHLGDRTATKGGKKKRSGRRNQGQR